MISGAITTIFKTAWSISMLSDNAGDISLLTGSHFCLKHCIVCYSAAKLQQHFCDSVNITNAFREIMKDVTRNNLSFHLTSLSPSSLN